MSDQQEFDVVVVGAGISGIDIGYRLQTSNPDLSYTILEGRSSIGGTWDLFKYPGLRSDSDMYTLGFPFEPWQGERSIAGGDDILAYIKHTASKYAIDQHIQLDTMVRGISWSSEQERWTVRVDRADGPGEVRAKYVYFASGYYSYEAPYTPPFPGRETFRGQVVHPHAEERTYAVAAAEHAAAHAEQHASRAAAPSDAAQHAAEAHLGEPRARVQH